MSSSSTSPASGSTVLSHLEEFLSFTPPSLKIQDDSSALPNFLLSFLDRNVADIHLLKRVVVSDAIVPQLLQKANMALSNMEHISSSDSMTTDFLSNAGHTCNTSPADVWDVANNYRSMVGSSSAHITSSYVTGIYNSKNQLFSDSPIIKPKHPLLDQFSGSRIYAAKLDGNQVADTAFLYDTETKDEKCQNIEELFGHRPHCITYQMLAPTTSARKLLSNIKYTDNFPWLGNSTTGVPPPAPTSLGKPIDSSITRELVEVHGPRRSRRLKDRDQPKTPQRLRTRRGELTLRTGKTLVPTPLSSRDLVQELWSMAVSKDTTWMVWHCGTHERIGFRHRETQTLYISDLIPVQRNTQYTRLHMGLHITALEESFVRLDKQKAESKESGTYSVYKHNVRTKKRCRWEKVEEEDIDGGPTRNQRKRIKLESSTNSSTSQYLLPHEELSSDEDNNWILMSFKLGHSNSPAPGFFNRCDISTQIVNGRNETKVEAKIQPNSSYPLSEALHIQLIEYIGGGAVGDTYRAQLDYYETDRNDTDNIRLRKAYTPIPLVVKLAYSPSAQKRLSTEARAYRYLQQRQEMGENTSFATKMYGCFQNVEQDVMALVMEYGGVSVSDMSGDKENPIQIEYKDNWRLYKLIGLSNTLKDKIRLAVTQLHQLPMTNGDIRPHNILVSIIKDDRSNNEEEIVKLIDFDNSRIEEQNERRISLAQAQELQKVNEILNEEWMTHGMLKYNKSEGCRN